MKDSLKSKVLFRDIPAAFIREDADEEKRTINLSFSSEEPVERFFGTEILDHNTKSVRMDRLRQGAPLLVNHSTDDQVGVIEDARIDATKKRGLATARFGNSARAKEIFDDVKEGIRRNVSVGYRVHDEDHDKKSNEVRINDWEPMEISIVAVPADNSVGVGRSTEAYRAFTEFERNYNVKKEKGNMPEGNDNPNTPSQGASNSNNDQQRNQPPVDIEVIREQERKAERERQASISATIEQFRGRVPDIEKAGQDAIRDGTGAKEFGQWVLANFPKQEAKTGSAEIGMNKKEIKRYSLVRAMNMISNQKPLDGLERECSVAVEKEIGRSPQGFFVPMDVQTAPIAENEEVRKAVISRLGQRALQTDTGSAGGFTVGTDLLGDSMIELLRNSSVIMSLGARSLGGLRGNVALPSQTGGATATWRAEGEADTETLQTFGQLTLEPHRLAALTGYSKQLLAQSSIDIEGFVRSDIAIVIALAKDLAAIAGTGAGGEPLGILNTTGIGTGPTYGGAPTWANVVAHETTLNTANANLGSVAFLLSSSSVGKWKTTPKVTNQPIYLIEGGQANGYPAVRSNQVPAAGTHAHKSIFGNFADMIIADWDGMDVVVDPFTLAANNQVRTVVNMHSDVGIRHAASFVVSADAANQ